jgi:hypothetical protein
MAWIDYLTLWAAKLVMLAGLLLGLIWIWEYLLDRFVRMYNLQKEFITWYRAKKRKVMTITKDNANEIAAPTTDKVLIDKGDLEVPLRILEQLLSTNPVPCHQDKLALDRLKAALKKEE